MTCAFAPKEGIKVLPLPISWEEGICFFLLFLSSLSWKSLGKVLFSIFLGFWYDLKWFIWGNCKLIATRHIRQVFLQGIFPVMRLTSNFTVSYLFYSFENSVLYANWRKRKLPIENGCCILNNVLRTFSSTDRVTSCRQAHFQITWH